MADGSVNDLTVYTLVNEIKNKLDAFVSEITLSTPATVGSGGRYATLQAALDARQCSVIIISDLETTGDLLAPAAGWGFLIKLEEGITATFTNSFFRAANDFDTVAIEGRRPSSAKEPFSPTDLLPVVRVVSTDGAHEDDGFLQGLPSASLAYLRCRVDSETTNTSVPIMDMCGAYLASDIVMEYVTSTVTVGGIRDGVGTAQSGALSNSLFDCSGNSAVSGMNIMSLAAARLLVTNCTLDGGGFVNANSMSLSASGSVVENCTVSELQIDINANNIRIVDSTLSNVSFQNTTGMPPTDPTLAMEDTQLHGNNIIIDATVGTQVFSGERVNITGGVLVLSGSLSITGDSCVFTGVAMDTGAGCTITGDKNVFQGCSVHNTGNFDISVEGTASENRFIGNELISFSSTSTGTGLGTVLNSSVLDYGASTVGTGGRYATLENAVAVGQTWVLVVSDLTVTSDLVAPSENTKFHIQLMNGTTLTFQDASFSGSNWWSIFMEALIENDGSNPVVELSLPTDTAPTVSMEWNLGTHTNTGLFDSASQVNVRGIDFENTASTDDGSYFARNVSRFYADRCQFSIGGGSSLTQAGFYNTANLQVFQLSDVTMSISGDLPMTFMDAQASLTTLKDVSFFCPSVLDGHSCKLYGGQNQTFASSFRDVLFSQAIVGCESPYMKFASCTFNEVRFAEDITLDVFRAHNSIFRDCRIEVLPATTTSFQANSLQVLGGSVVSSEIIVVGQSDGNDATVGQNSLWSNIMFYLSGASSVVVNADYTKILNCSVGADDTGVLSTLAVTIANSGSDQPSKCMYVGNSDTTTLSDSGSLTVNANNVTLP